MRNLYIAFVVFSVATNLCAQTETNPFAKYGLKKVMMATFSKGEFEEFHKNKEIVEIGSVLYNTKTKEVIGYIDENIENDVTSATPAMSIDPHCEKYPWITPYAYALNNPVRFIDPDGQDVYLLFYTVGNSRGDEAFKAAAQTRKEAIESRKNFNSKTDKVLMVGVSDISDVGTMSEWAANTYGEQYGQTAEVGVWSHGGWDGPTGTEPASVSPLFEGSRQMSPEGWGSFNFNWKEGASMSFYGCNTGRDEKGGEWVGSFSRKVSALDNMKGGDVWGQASYTYTSIYPNERASTYLREKNIFFGPTYFVGGNDINGEVMRSMWFYPFSSNPPAIPMNVYRGGKKIRSAFQGF